MCLIPPVSVYNYSFWLVGGLAGWLAGWLVFVLTSTRLHRNELLFQVQGKRCFKKGLPPGFHWNSLSYSLGPQKVTHYIQ